jgi:hypothetical protein
MSTNDSKIAPKWFLSQKAQLDSIDFFLPVSSKQLEIDIYHGFSAV